MTLKKDVFSCDCYYKMQIAILIIVEKIELVSSFIYSQRMQIWSLDFTIHSTKHGGNTLQVSDTGARCVRKKKKKK